MTMTGRWKICVALAITVGSAAPHASVAQGLSGGVAGTVRSEAGEPLPRARVAVPAAGRSALTDGAGRFTLRGLPAGRHRVEASLLGYAPATAVVVVRAGVTTEELAITLSTTPLSLPGVQVTASPGGNALAARAATQLGGRALVRSLASTVAGTLQGQPGISVRYNGPAASAPMVRGLSGDRVLVLQDGLRAADLSGSADDHAVTVDPLAAQRIEVVRGPAALLYGNNALGGVVNVITADVPDRIPSRPEGMASLQSESAFPGGAGSVRLTVPAGQRWALTLRGGARAAGDVRIGHDPVLGSRLPNTGQRNWNGAAGLGYQGERVTGGMAVRGYGFGYGIPVPPGEAAVELRGRAMAASARADVTLPGTRFPALRLSGTAQEYHHDELEHGAVQMAFGLRTQTADVLLRQDRIGPFREGAWGVSALLRQYVATGEDQLAAPADSRAFGVFGYQETGLVGAATLQLGVRADRHRIASRDDPQFGPGVERAFTALSGSVGVAVPLGSGVTAGVSAARSYRAPTVEELFSGAPHAGTASYEVGDPTLSPEVALGAEAVLRVHGPRVSGELSTHRTSVAHFVHFAARGDTMVGGTRWPVLAYVQQGATLTGAEGRVEWVVSRGWVASAHGDWLRASLADGGALPFMPPARIGGSLRWEGGALTAGGAVRHAFGQPRVGLDDETPTAAYTLADLDGGVRLHHGGVVHSLTLRAENLTNRAYRDAASRIKAFAPSPGRNVALTYRVLF
jgi:iron complex outermembrane recepter protein